MKTKIGKYLAVDVETLRIYRFLGRKSVFVGKCKTEEQFVRYLAESLIIEDYENTEMSITEHNTLYEHNVKLVTNILNKAREVK